MKYALVATAIIAAITSRAAGQACAPGEAKEINGNWYCSPVEAISYTNFGSSGKYNKITSMANGVCSSEPQSYSGPMAPMNEEVGGQPIFSTLGVY